MTVKWGVRKWKKEKTKIKCIIKEDFRNDETKKLFSEKIKCTRTGDRIIGIVFLPKPWKEMPQETIVWHQAHDEFEDIEFEITSSKLLNHA